MKKLGTRKMRWLTSVLEQDGGGVETRTQDSLSSDRPVLGPHPQPAGKGPEERRHPLLSEEGSGKDGGSREGEG